ncbi:hypothetical protein STRCI_000710 [Streptomyces cinnabarinus]|uniref:Uncharacterized protein n=1 Tax=Streptomyces cinnabarinus TaxID=67287 RepID=A0ABY7K8M8_9ACTN|nr:hypothetical protein [Streptomyces cinnabarinus]WAZ19647.1 hypothetical protein STRCI_000710 [Streptomyces cinnabarinus]
MNAEPNRKKPAKRRAASARAARGGSRPPRGRDTAEVTAAGVAGVRLDLPVLGTTIERRWDFYQPHLEVVGTYEPVGEPPGTIGQYVEQPGPQSRTGHVPGDPGPPAGRDGRGWSCPSAGTCVWAGIV